MAVRLKQAGFTDFDVFDANSGPAGTWWANDYPGAEVDVHSSIYCFPFKDYNWTRTHARRPELAKYIDEALDDFGIRSHFHFNVRIAEVRWSDSKRTYNVVRADGAESEYEVVVSAVGLLSDPKIPAWPGLDEFDGPLFHSSQWRHDVDLAGKNVAVVGVGSTATQIVPAIAGEVKKLYVFQREPGWILPKGDRDFDEAEFRYMGAHPVKRRVRRLRNLARSEWAHSYQPIYMVGSKRHKRAERISLDYIDRVFADRLDLKKAVTPAYTFSAKRRVLTSDFYPALLRENVELVPHAVDHLTRHGVVDDTGREHEVDVVVAATGFKASSFLSSLRAYGRGGRDLHEVWRDGAYAFVGVAVPGFPNFYMMYGPNTNGGAPITYMHDQQAKYVVRNLRRMVRHRIRAIDVRPVFVTGYNSWVQSRMAGTAWLEGNNYFRGPNGQIVTQWRDGLLLYALLIWLLRRPASRRVRGSRMPKSHP
jgi:cation diffusion facilitator CzcD-associated flavoprotein CzcO